MPRPANLDRAIRAIVAEEIAESLAPLRRLLGRMAIQMRETPARRGPGRPPKSAATPVRRRRRGAKAKAALRAAKNFHEGQKVVYKQGRGSFDAKVVRVDAAKGLVTVERLKDGKRVVRPPAKLK
jgi:hypothetical protein